MDCGLHSCEHCCSDHATYPSLQDGEYLLPTTLYRMDVSAGEIFEAPKQFRDGFTGGGGGEGAAVPFFLAPAISVVVGVRSKSRFFLLVLFPLDQGKAVG